MNKPLIIINEQGVKVTHRIITTCFKMDTKEYSKFTHTKNINYATEYGCSRCNDKNDQLMNPNRYSSQYPRGVEQIIEIAGIDIPTNDSCVKFDDWKMRGKGYVPMDVNTLPDELEPDPSYIIATDMSHLAKNLIQQLFSSLMQLEPLLKKKRLSLFKEMISICQYNNFTVQLTMKNWSKSPDFLTDITLELAPIALVNFILIAAQFFLSTHAIFFVNTHI